MQDEERFERLLEVLEELAEENAAGVPIVVEGRRDVHALRILGCHGEIHPINAGDSLHQRAETLAAGASEVILLTDWDRKGHELFDAMRARFAANSVRVNGDYHDKIQMWMRPPVKDVESLASYVARAMAKFYGRELGEHSS